MSKKHDKNLPRSAKSISKEITPYLILPKASSADENSYEDEDETNPLLGNSKGAIYNYSSVNIPKTNFSKLLNPQSKDSNLSWSERLGTRVNESTVGKVLSWVTSKGAVKIANIVVPIFAFTGLTALSGGIVPFVALGLAGAAITFNSLRDTRALRALKELEQEHMLLQEYKAAKNIELQAINLLKNKTGIDLSSSESAEEKISAIQPKFKSKYENNLTLRPLRKTIMDSLFEACANIATVVVVATSGLANAASHALSVGGMAAILTVVDIILTTKARKKMNTLKNAMRKDIDQLRDGIPPYKSITQLKEFTQKQKIKTEALMQVLKQDVTQLDEKSLKDRINEEMKIAGSKAEFVMPVEPSFWEKTKQYFKDFNMVNWPNNDYYSPDKFATKLDRNTAIVAVKYRDLSEQIHAYQKIEVGIKRSRDKHNLSHVEQLEKQQGLDKRYLLH